MFKQLLLPKQINFRLNLNSFSRTTIRFQSISTNPSNAYTSTINDLKLNLKQAMIAKQSAEKTIIRSIISDIKNNEINGGLQDEFNLYKVFNKMINQRINSSNEYLNQNRNDLSIIELNEVKIIEKFLNNLPIATKEENIQNLSNFIKKLNDMDSNYQMGKIFPLINNDLAKLWNTSVDLVKPLIPQVYKDVFKKK